MIFSPLSEIPSIGRNPVYAYTLVIFTLVSIPAALADQFGVLLALRCLQGFFGSPCLGTAPGSLQDMFTEIGVSYAMIGYVAAGYAGPALGPAISGYAVTAMGWRWSLWLICWVRTPEVVCNSENF